MIQFIPHEPSLMILFIPQVAIPAMAKLHDPNRDRNLSGTKTRKECVCVCERERERERESCGNFPPTFVV